jgi:hypothetical protein
MLPFAPLALAALTASSGPIGDPYAIFARARRYWESQRYPARLQYTVVVTVLEGGKTRIERYRSGYDGIAGVVAFDPVSDEEREHPYVPHGVNVGFLFWRIGKPEPPADYLGVPELAPNYSFGIGTTPLSEPPHKLTSAELVRQIREEFHDPDPRASPTPSPQPSPVLREIAAVMSKTRAYDITLLGVERVDGSDAYHLRLHPLREPKRYRLRELWIDAQSYAPRKLVEALNFENGPGTAVPWTIAFAQRGGATYVASETAMAPMSYSGMVYVRASVSIEDLREVAAFDDDLTTTFVPGERTLMMTEP